ncbi:MAG: hypothetical protein M1826_001815 [Phylliscum demangeonii]|nr:MAG: hypothetical protein M1826_001815 [Phylliscum demangeonii]
MQQGSEALERAVNEVGRHHPNVKCEQSDGRIPPLDPNSPENSAGLEKGSTRDTNYNVPFKGRSDGNPPRRPSSIRYLTGPPSARDNWSAEEPYHTPLKIDPICVLSQRAQGFTPAAAAGRCRYKPFHKQQQRQPLAIPAIPGTVPGTAPILEPAIPLAAPGLGGAGLLLRGGV